MNEGIKLESPTVSPSGLPPVPLFGYPQSPGWYWSRIKAQTCDAVTLHRVDWCDHSKGFVIVSRYDDPLPIDRYPADQWYGPLTPPQWPNVPALAQTGRRETLTKEEATNED